jgi:hypothetical protein
VEAAVAGMCEIGCSVPEVLVTMTIRSLLAVLTASLLLIPAAAQEPKTSVREIVTLAGTVERVDRSSRTLTLTIDNSFRQSLYVPPQFKVFDELKPGDRVEARIRESVVVSARPGLKPRLPADTTADDARKAQLSQQLTAVVTIENIDRTTNWVTYKTADNRRVVRAVADPRLLDGLKPGDVIEVTLTRERVIELERR